MTQKVILDLNSFTILMLGILILKVFGMNTDLLLEIQNRMKRFLPN